MPTNTVPADAPPAAKQDADAGTTETAGSLAALMGFKELATQTTSAGAAEAANEQNTQPEAGPEEPVLSQPETASDGAPEEVEGGKLKAERPEAETDSDPDASAEEDASKPKDDAKAEAEGEDALEEWLATLPKGAARKLRQQHRQIAELKQALADAKAKQPTVEAKVSESAPVVIDNRLEHITDLRELEAVEAKSRDTLRNAERALDAVDDLRDQLDVDPEAVARQLKAAKYDPPEDRDGLMKLLAEIKRGIRSERAKATGELDAVPKRRSHLEQEARVMEQAAADYPWLKSREGDDYQLFEKILQARPQVRQMGPDWPFAAAVFVEGLKSLNARRAAKAKAAPVVAKAAAAPPPKQPSRSAPPRPAAGSAARSRFEQSGNQEDLAALMPA